jgi:hypothetical protein
MVNLATRTRINTLLESKGVLDVYWHKGRLLVINDYDLDTVQSCLEGLGLDSVVAVLADEHVDLMAY